MSTPGAFLQLGVPRAHPVSGHPHVDVPEVLVVTATAVAVVLALVLTPGRAEGPAAGRPAASWAGSLSTAQWATRAVALALLVLAVAAGRFGSRVELENLAPALVVGVAWPLVTALSLLLPVWRWVDPWDSAARLLAPGDRSAPPGHVWPAVLLLVPLAWFVGVYERALDPRAVGLVLLLYTTVTVAGCLAWGRRRWLSSCEPVGILLTLLHSAARGRRPADGLARGAELLVGAAVGAMLFAVLRRTGVWSGNTPVEQARLYATAGLLVCGALGAGLLVLAGRLGRTATARTAVVVGALPALAGIVVAFGLERNRLFTSVQLLPGLFGDPLGRGWDLFGPAAAGVRPDLLGAADLVAVQLGVVAVAFLWGAVASARQTARRDRAPAAVVLVYLAAVSVLLVALH